VVRVGLFLGLQLNEWWEGREDRVLERHYLERLAADHEYNRGVVSELVAGSQRRMTTIAALRQSLDGSADPPGADALDDYRRWDLGSGDDRQRSRARCTFDLADQLEAIDRVQDALARP
jgi:hypothetical protein